MNVFDFEFDLPGDTIVVVVASVVVLVVFVLLHATRYDGLHALVVTSKYFPVGQASTYSILL